MNINFGKELMKRYGNVIYNYFLSKFVEYPARYYIRPNNRADLKDFMKKCMDDRGLAIMADILKEKCVEPNNYDELVIDLLRYVRKIITYKSDQLVWNTPEYWQTAKETFKKLSGDCEDGAILLVTLARLAGIPSNRIFLSCGYTMYKERMIGHAYVTYRGNDGIEYILDWNIHYQRNRIPHRNVFGIDNRYIMPRWFFGNDDGFYKR